MDLEPQGIFQRGNGVLANSCALHFGMFIENRVCVTGKNPGLAQAMSFGGPSVADCFLYDDVFDFNKIIVCTYGYSWWPNQ